MAVVIPADPMVHTVEQPTLNLRFERRLKQKILQQLWEVVSYENGAPVATQFEWRDVPEVKAT